MKPCHAGLFFLLVILLTACQSSRIIGMAAQPGEKLFWDDFSDASGNWPQGSSANGSLGIADGAYRIKVLSTHYEVLATHGDLFQDAQVEADATRLAGPVQNMFGLVCRSSNPDNFTFFVISSDGYYALGKVKNGKTALLGQEMMAQNSAVPLGDGPVHLRFNCSGEMLTGYVNGQVIATSKDTDLAPGKVGLVAGSLDTAGVEVGFDNFSVYKP